MKNVEVIKLSENQIEIDGVKYLRQELEFKTGTWIMIGDKGCLCSTHDEGAKYKGWKFNGTPNHLEPMRVITIKDISYQPCALIVEQREQVFIFSKRHNSRPATKEEIESHLIKVAKEKFTGKRIKSLSCDFVYTATNKFWYDDEYLHMTAKESEWEKQCSDPRVYNNLTNKWAEILPLKKPLPKTKEEFEQFIEDWEDTKIDVEFNEFFSKYE